MVVMPTALCHACLFEFTYTSEDYILCHNCGSWNLPPLIDALQANKSFYNEIYEDLESAQTSFVNKKIFSFFSKIDKKRQQSVYELFRGVFDEHQVWRAGHKVLEVGFGQGRHLLKLLRAGIDAYGIDLSETAVRIFQDKYPQHRERVTIGSRYSSQVDVVYSSALFEHLEDPEAFIADAAQSLRRGGLLVLDALPIVIADVPFSRIKHDINFWSPCHRAIYSVDGLRMLFGNQGFALCGSATLDSFNNRVLSLHLAAGYGEMARLRDATVIYAGMPGALQYARLCLRALSSESVANFGRFVFRKDA